MCKYKLNGVHVCVGYIVPHPYRASHTASREVYLLIHIHLHKPMSVAVELPFCLQDQERMNLSLQASRPVPATTCTRGASPKCQSAQEAYHCHECSTVRSVIPTELARLMEMAKTLLLLDCRSFIAYNLNHINGALNVSCCDRFSKRRLQGGKASVADLISGDNDAKTIFKELVQSEIVLYDDKTKDSSQLSSTSPIHLVMSSLLKEGKEVYILKGKSILMLT